ncbi:MAG: hypothetical protein H0U63_01515 [Burkholderiales bacterium]|nr:hypothetical protein [Burkholderiales bacterium]
MPLGNIFSSQPSPGGLGQRLMSGMQNNSGLLMGLGAGMLAHRQNANNPMMDPQTIMLGQAADQQRLKARQEEAMLTQTAQYLMKKDPTLSESDAMSIVNNPTLLADALKGPEPAGPSGEWKVVGDQLAWAPNDGSEPQFQQAPGAGEPSAEDQFKIEGPLRDDYRTDPKFKRYDEINSAYRRIRESVQSDSGPGDIGVVFGYMKLLDPNSTVRENEFATAENSSGVSAKVRNLFNKLKTGERLEPGQRQEFAAAAHQLYAQEAITMKGHNKTYRRLAEQYKVNPDNVTFMDVEEYDPLGVDVAPGIQLGSGRKVRRVGP